LPKIQEKKKNKMFGTEGMAQVVEYLPSKHKALSPNPNTERKEEG
jgi:hypothetical protein